MSDRRDDWSRREFVSELALAGTAGLLGLHPHQVAAEPSQETTRLRVLQLAAICAAPMHVAEELLRSEGFSDLRYVRAGGSSEVLKALGSGKADMTQEFAGGLVMRIDAGDPILILAGSHPGCAELFANNQVRGIRDLKGKTVAVPELGSGSMQHLVVASMAAHVGLDPRRDIKFIVSQEDMKLFTEGKIDAYLGFPPTAHELRAKKIGHVVVNTMMDRPWSQYFCCMIAGNRDFVRRNPVATKRALRTIQKAANLCSLEPDRVARLLVEKGYTEHYEWTREAIKETPYGNWREYDAEDSVRFWALRLHEAGMIKSSPKKIIAQGTDWRFLNELKNESKG
jgi:NitT/TauT family transport system substrate-binding protein